MKGRKVMNILLIFFALPIAVIIISIALQKILKNPALVAAIIFAIFLIVTFIINNLNFLVAAIVYAIISFITAFIVCIICRFLNRFRRENECCCRRDNECCCRRENTSGCCGREERSSCNNNTDNVLTISNIQDNTSNCGCNQNNNERSYQITSPNGITTRVNIVSNSNNNCINSTNRCGCCRRR